MYELQFIYDKIVQRFSMLKAETFYSQIEQIGNMNEADQPALLKAACDRLLRNIRVCIGDEAFIHQLYDVYGFGVDKVISTLYAVFGYYFFTGKRTANVIKKTIDGYKKRPAY